MAEFLEKVKQGFGKGMTVFTVKSREMMNVAKIKNQLHVLQERRDLALYELGDSVFQMYLQQGFNEEKIRVKCEQVALLGSQAFEKETDLRHLRLKAKEALGKSFCEFCESELPNRAAFCSNCGEKVLVERDTLH